MTWFVTLLTPAAAVEPEATVALAAGTTPEATEAAPPWLGAAFGAALDAGRLGADLDVRAGPTPSAPGAGGLARLRLHVDLGDAGVGALVGAGVSLGLPHRPVASAGLDLRLGAAPRAARPRLQLELAAGPAAPWQLTAALGVALRRAAAAPAPVAAAPTRVDLDEAMVWVPAPVCTWLAPDPANAAFAEAALAVADPVALDERTVRDPAADPFAPRPVEDPRGRVIVAAWPGDRVEVDGVALPLGPDGVGWTRHADGPALVTVSGGGRRQTLEVEVAPETALWVVADPPAPAEVRFPTGLATLDPDAAAAVRELAAAAGQWTLEVRGGFSSEGTPDRNVSLAEARAAVVREALVVAGVDAARVRVGPPLPLDPAVPPERQRVATILPVAPEAP